MADLELVDLGTVPNDGTGDDLRTTGSKINLSIAAVNSLNNTPPSGGTALTTTTDTTNFNNNLSVADTDLQKALETIDDMVLGGSGESQLELITEGTGTGWRLLGTDPLNYGDIGDGAVDLSSSDTPSAVFGATQANSFAVGKYVIAGGHYSSAFGESTEAAATASHAEGYLSSATAIYAHAENHNTTASGAGSHSEGLSSAATGDYSHAQNGETQAVGQYSHSEGNLTIAKNASSHAAGKFNIGTSVETIHETGIGTGTSTRKNAFEIYTNGRIHAPEQTIVLHDDPKSLVTKEYIEQLTLVDSNTTLAGTGSIAVTNIVSISQVDYDALGAGRPAGTLYIING